MWFDGHEGYMMFPGFGILVLIVIVIIIIMMVGKKGDSCCSKDESALDILKKRYAKGEISKEEFQKRKKEIQDDE